MNDPRFNGLLKWGIENSEASRNDPNAPKNPDTKFDPSVLQQIFTGQAPLSDADMMKKNMGIITEPEYTLEEKKDAFEDFLYLVENLDNANNMQNLFLNKDPNNAKNMPEDNLWNKLIDQLHSGEAELRKFAAWCAGTAVENNAQTQERLLILGAIPTLVKLATEDKDMEVRKKAVRALSCASRNYQPALDTVVNHVPSQFKPKNKLDAGDMASVDSLIHPLKADAERSR